MQLQKIMDGKNISQYRLEKDSGVSQAQISRLLAGICQPKLKTLQKLSKALGVSVSELIDDQQDKEISNSKTSA